MWDDLFFFLSSFNVCAVATVAVAVTAAAASATWRMIKKSNETQSRILEISVISL